MAPSIPNPTPQSGNILVYILGAIILLGLLVIVTKGSNTAGSGIDYETTTLRVSEVQQYAQELEQAIAYVLRNDHSEADIRFAHPDADVAYGDITDTPTRQIFSRSGGGAAFRAPPEDIQTSVTPWVFNARNVVNGVSSSDDCTTDACVDLIALLMNVTKEFCVLVNNKNDIENTDGDPPQDEGSVEYTTLFNGTYSQSQNISDTAENLLNAREGCFEGGTDPAADTYHYYRVLMAR